GGGGGGDDAVDGGPGSPDGGADDVDAAPGTPDARPGPDATPAACGLPAPGSRCASATSLERCDGDQKVTVDCAAQGGFCAPDPDVEGGAACAANGDDCGRIDVYG